MDAELIFDARNSTGESPVWVAAEEALYWVDIQGRTLNRWQAATRKVTHWAAPEMIGCIAQHSDGGWIAGMESGVFHLLPLADGSLQTRSLIQAAHNEPAMRFNDGRCDRQGRFLPSTMLINKRDSGHQPGTLFSYSGSGTLQPIVSGLRTPNGLAFSPDGATMYLSDSNAAVQLIWAFDYDIHTGQAHNRRVFVDMNPLPGRPDGAAVDADGCYWICGNDAGLVHRFTPQGKLDRSVVVPVKRPAMCAFGGAKLDILYVTSIRPDNIDLADQPLAGGVFAVNPKTQGLPEPTFKAD
jgi:sugar lactone lactonase YvrE